VLRPSLISSYSPECLERLSGNSEEAPLRGPLSLQNGANRYPFGRFALLRDVPIDPSCYFPDSLWKGYSPKFGGEKEGHGP